MRVNSRGELHGQLHARKWRFSSLVFANGAGQLPDKSRGHVIEQTCLEQCLHIDRHVLMQAIHQLLTMQGSSFHIYG